MSHNLRILYLLFFCFAVSCNKPLPDYSHQPFDYSVTGISDVSVAANNFVFFNSSINIVSGFAEHEPVTVSFKGLPANVYLKSDNYSVLLNYVMSDSIGARNATPGVYPVQMILNNTTAGSKIYNFNLTITAPISRVAEVAGYYYPSNSCGSNIYVSCEIDPVQGTPGKVMLIDRTSLSDTSYGTFDTCYGYVDCCANTFTVPSQNVQGTTVSGSGSFNAQSAPYNVVILNRTFAKGSSSYSCTVTLSQH
jgi:hypothetical protein